MDARRRQEARTVSADMLLLLFLLSGYGSVAVLSSRAVFREARTRRAAPGGADRR